MIKLTICKGNEKNDIYVNHHNYLVGNNYKIKTDILRTVLRYYSCYKPSEYAIENNNIPALLINDQLISIKETLMFYENGEYHLNEECKLSSKTLMNRYMELLLSDQQFCETINTINILMESLGIELSQSSILSSNFIAMVPKQLIKLMNPFYCKDELIRDEYDLSIEEIILIQLEMIEYISIHDTSKSMILICLVIPEITKEISRKIQDLKYCIILIFEQYPKKTIENIENYYICENVCVDLANEEDLYEKICDNHKKLLSLEEGREYMKKYLEKNGTPEARFIESIIK